MNESKFQFKGFRIVRSLIESKGITRSKKISLIFNPKGIINKSNSTFTLQLGMEIEDDNQSFSIEIDAVADFVFDSHEGLSTLNDYFYVNAPALLFPYLRAYISTLTNLSGFDPITLPTLNMTGLGEDLKRNTEEIS